MMICYPQLCSYKIDKQKYKRTNYNMNIEGLVLSSDRPSADERIIIMEI